MQKRNPLGENPNKKPLRPYQVDDLAFYISQKRCANLSDPGTGKTPSVCAYAQYLWEYKGFKTAWAMPKSLIGKNVKELLRFTDFKEEDIVAIDGTKSEREIQARSPGKVFLMGFSRFSDDWRVFKELHPELNALLVDEIHMGYKGNNSARTQNMYKAMKKLTHFLPMTGSLIDGRLDAAFPTIHVIEPRYYGNHRQFLYYHGVYDFLGNLVDWQNHDKLGRIFQRHAIRRSFQSIFGKEAKVIEKILCPMGPSMRESYDEFESQAILELEDSFLDAAGLPGVHAMRCRQIMAHPETFGLCHKETTGKDERLIVDLTDHYNRREPIAIFSALIPEQERLVEVCKKVGLQTELINSSVPSRKRTKIDEAFQAGELDAIVGSPATSSFGFNWDHLDHIIFVSLDYMNTTFVQAYRRAIRGVRKKPLHISVYEYEDSIDQRIFEIVDYKSRQANKVDSSYEKLDLSDPAYVETYDKEVSYTLADF